MTTSQIICLDGNIITSSMTNVSRHTTKKNEIGTFMQLLCSYWLNATGSLRFTYCPCIERVPLKLNRATTRALLAAICISHCIDVSMHCSITYCVHSIVVLIYCNLAFIKAIKHQNNVNELRNVINCKVSPVFVVLCECFIS